VTTTTMPAGYSGDDEGDRAYLDWLQDTHYPQDQPVFGADEFVALDPTMAEQIQQRGWRVYG
jgi:hypothetical protein